MNLTRNLFFNIFQAKRQLAQYGIYSETDRSTSTNAASHYSLVSNLTATYATVGDRGSSADSGCQSGVRLSSDRDSATGLPTTGNLSDSANEGTYIHDVKSRNYVQAHSLFSMRGISVATKLLMHKNMYRKEKLFFTESVYVSFN